MISIKRGKKCKKCGWHVCRCAVKTRPGRVLVYLCAVLILTNIYPFLMCPKLHCAWMLFFLYVVLAA